MNPIKIDMILCEDNRKVTKTQVTELANSIKAVGLINSITLIHSVTKDYDYEVIAGRKRFQALLKLGYTEITEDMFTIVKDGDADLIAYEENVTRANMTLYEEITHLDTLRLKYGDIKQLAEVMHSSVRAINTRLCLLNLNKDWINSIKKGDIGNFTIPMLKIVSQLSERGQSKLFNRAGNVENLKDLNEWLLGNIVQRINQAQWNGKEGDWFKSCEDCEYNSKNTEYLLDEFKEENGVCGNSECWNEKKNAYFKYLLFEYMNLDLDEYHIITSYYGDGNKEELKALIESGGFKKKKIKFWDNYNITEKNRVAKKDKDKYHKAFKIPSSYDCDAAYITYISKVNADFKNGTKNNGIEMSEIESLETGLASRRAKHEKKRKRSAIESLIIALNYTAGETYQCKFPDDEELFILTNIIGSNDIRIDEFHGLKTLAETLSAKTDSDLYTLATLANYDEYVKIVNPELQRQLIWHNVSKGIKSVLKYGQSGACEPSWKEAEIISRIIEFDLIMALDEATDAIPEPKSWKAITDKIRKYNASDFIFENGIFEKDDKFIIPISVLEAFNVKVKSELPDTFYNYDALNCRVFCRVVDEKIKDRVVKAVCKLMIKSIDEIKIITFKENENEENN